MDPNVCMERLIDAAGDNDHEEVCAAASDLQDWLQKGGFMPDVTNPRLWRLLDIICNYATYAD